MKMCISLFQIHICTFTTVIHKLSDIFMNWKGNSSFEHMFTNMYKYIFSLLINFDTTSEHLFPHTSFKLNFILTFIVIPKATWAGELLLQLMINDNLSDTHYDLLSSLLRTIVSQLSSEDMTDEPIIIDILAKMKSEILIISK